MSTSCGDAKRVANDVERALVDIVAQFGTRSTDEAIAFIADLKKKGRFQQDVYRRTGRFQFASNARE
jgi:sulfite reductase (NADPH) flavoprotein alpha-component